MIKNAVENPQAIVSELVLRIILVYYFDWWLSLQSKETRMSHDFFFPSFSNLPIFCEFPIGAYEALEIQMKINR